MSLTESKGIWLMAGLVAAAAVVLIWIVVSARPLRLVILYDEAGGLKQDDPVVWGGQTIGKVEGVKLLPEKRVEVSILIREDYASKISHGAEFILRKASFFGLIGDNAIEVVIPSSEGTPFHDGEKVAGKIALSSWVDEGKKWSREYWRQLGDETQELIAEFENSPFRKEAQGILDQLKSLAEQGSKETKDRLDDFRKAHSQELEEALNRLERLRDEMRRQYPKGAAQVEKEIERLKK
jgi:hypothetical protein